MSAAVQLFAPEYGNLTSIIQRMNQRLGTGFSLGSLDRVQFADGWAYVPLEGMSKVQWGVILGSFQRFYPEADISQQSHTKYLDELTLMIHFPRTDNDDADRSRGSACNSLRRCLCCCCYLGLREWAILVVLCAIAYYYLVERAIDERIFDGQLRSWYEYVLEAIYQVAYSSNKINVIRRGGE